MLEFLQAWLQGHGASEYLAFFFARGITALTVLLLSVIVNFVAKRYILTSLTYVITRTKTKWDDAILRQGAPGRLAHLAPALVIFVLTPFALEGMETAIAFIRGATQIYMIIILTLVIDALLNTVEEIYRGIPGIQRDSYQGFYPDL